MTWSSTKEKWWKLWCIWWHEIILNKVLNENPTRLYITNTYVCIHTHKHYDIILWKEKVILEKSYMKIYKIVNIGYLWV